ncbi:hypothetical protein BZJ17_14160 [Salinivibrio sp. IB574]|uniref:hypothetical protein n=1 Tax=Salinivibrio sp. IB574 TaxID=1909444 RepID=UPI000989389F|nr:hypothetical protein [Salinivibrio sp. IB574]OOF20057.1 hypothetical protein BZJ17_14160 [Salinivibrio sp. IB574]
MDIFNNREIAIGFWLLAISAYALLSPKMVEVRSSFKHLLSAFFVKQIMSVLGLMVAYMMFVVYFLFEMDLWNTEQIKNTIFWSISVGFMSLFKIESIKKDKSFFKNSVLDNLKLLTILQFVLGVYTFPVWIEIILVPVFMLIGAMTAIAETDRKYHQVKILLEYFLSIFGIILIVYSLYMLTTNFSEFGNENTAYDFFIPPLLTLFYLPFVFFMLVYSTYEQVFIRLQFSIKNNLYRNLAKIYSIILFNFRMSLLDRWAYHVARINVESHDDLVESFRHMLKVRKAESNPMDVPADLGWSPSLAKEFLLCEGLSTGSYNKLFEENWFASSPMVEFSDGVIPDNIAYYVEGSEDAAKLLKLKVNVNDAARTRQACEKLESMAEVLTTSSLGRSLSEEMKIAISCCDPYAEEIEGKTVVLEVENWPSNKFNGFVLKFMISSI